MYTNTLKWYMASMFAVVMLFGGVVSFAQAELITDAEVETQREEVVDAITNALEQQLMLLQMMFIQKLEERIEYLQTLADDQ